MSSLLTRFTTFLPNTTILSNDHNQELNRIVNLLNGTTTNLKTVLKTSDAGDPPLELDQLSTGPIQKWFQGGILKASVANDGGFSTVGNLLISKSSPSIKFLDGANDFEFLFAGTTFRLNNNTGSFEVFNVPVSTSVVNFNAIPVGPASNPTTANQLPRKQYVDDKTTWTKTWFYPVLPGAVESVESVGRLVIIGGSRTITSITAVWAGGSDSGASNVFTIKRRNSAGTLQSDVGTVDVNTPAQNALQSGAVSVALADGDQIYPLFTTRNIASETLVSISVRGT